MNFNLHIPDDRYDFSRVNLPSINNHDRLIRLIHQAINGPEKKTEYELCDEVFHYGMGDYEAGTRYGLNFHINDRVCVIFSTQRDVAYPIAIFPLACSNDAAKYFVWLVSEGKCEINWTLFLDMEP